MWIARNKDGSLWLFDVKPRRGKDVWLCDDTYDPDGFFNIDDFQPPEIEVTWENSPKELIIKEELKGRQVTFTFNDVHKNFKLWDISDAKDGDVLISQYNNPFIYKRHCDELIDSYGGILYGNQFHVSEEQRSWTVNENIHPATKEQRDLLFQKMKEAGYEFDFEKKELIKIK